MDKWHGKVALVTGSSAGIGASVTKALANAGMIVIGLGRRVDAIQVCATFSPRYHQFTNFIIFDTHCIANCDDNDSIDNAKFLASPILSFHICNA